MFGLRLVFGGCMAKLCTDSNRRMVGAIPACAILTLTSEDVVLEDAYETCVKCNASYSETPGTLSFR